MTEESARISLVGDQTTNVNQTLDDPDPKYGYYYEPSGDSKTQKKIISYNITLIVYL